MPPLEPPASAIRLVAPLRVRGPFEEWRAVLEPSGRGITVRRARGFGCEAHDLRLQAGAAVARQVEHHAVRPCLGHRRIDGHIVQLFSDEGEVDLTSLADGGERPSVAETVFLGRQVCEALAHAHSLGVLHGALRPEAIAISSAGVVLVDFGLSFAPTRDSGEAAPTEPFDLRYAAPEQLGGPHLADHRADLYALGCIIWQLMTGQSYRDARQDAGQAWVPPSLLRPEIPDSVDACLALALRDDPQERINDARALSALFTRIFYRDLEASDAEHGHPAWALRAARIPRAAQTAAHRRAESGHPRVEPRPGPPAFTEELRARSSPVQPQDITTNDFPMDPRLDQGSWVVGMELVGSFEDVAPEIRRDPLESADTRPSHPPSGPAGPGREKRVLVACMALLAAGAAIAWLIMR